MTEEERGELETMLGHRFEHPERLERALTHRSHRQNAGGIDNERLEFLGDRVLGLVASERLFDSVSAVGRRQTFEGTGAARERLFDLCRGAAA